MPKVEILSETNSNTPDSTEPITESKPKTITFEFDLETGGTASFRMPLVKDLIDLGSSLDSMENNKIARILSDRTLLSWNSATTIPKEIDGADDNERVLIFLELLAPLITQLDPSTESENYTVNPDGSRTIEMSNGDKLCLRRLTVKENLIHEDAKVPSTERACRVVASAAKSWWKSRPMMPGDLYQLNLEDYGKVFKTLQSFRNKPSGKTRRRVVS